LGSERFFFLKKLILVISKHALYLSKMRVKYMNNSISISINAVC